LVREGKLNEAREILVKALILEPKSPVTRDLRDLLGNVNTQIFFSKEPSPRKTEYIVKQGDALSSIARNLDSSADAIMRVNNLDSPLIRPGEKLLVPRLDFAITIDLPNKGLVVHDDRGFFTQYPIVSAQLPPTRRSEIETKVGAKSFGKTAKRCRQIMECRNKPRRKSIWSTLAMCFTGSGKSDRRALPELLSPPMTTSKQWTLAMQIVRVRELR